VLAVPSHGDSTPALRARLDVVKLATRAVAEVVGLAAAALAAVLVFRSVGPTVAGELAIATTFFYLATVVVNGGLPTAAAQEVAARPESLRGVVLAAGGLRIAYAAAFTVAVEAILWVLPLGDSVRVLLMLTVVGVLLLPLKHDWLLIARGSVGSVAMARIVSASVTLAVAALVVRDPGDTGALVIYLLSGHAATALVTLAMAVVTEHDRIWGRDGIEGSPSWSLARKGLHYLKADLSIFVYNNSDRFFLFALGGPAVVGLYEAAYKLILPFSAIATVVTDSMYLTLARAVGTRALRDVYGRYVRLLFVGTVPVGFVTAVFGPAIVAVIFGDEFVAAGPLLAVLGWVVTVGYLSGAIAIPFTAWDRPKAYGDAITAGSVANLLLNVLLIPPLLGFGAAFATILAKLVVVLAGARPFRSVCDYPVFREFLMFALASATAVVVALATVTVLRLPGIVGVPLFAVIYGCGISLWFLRARRTVGPNHDQAVLERGSSL
jgi:O-antigen/teichoic acid export membrane protein